MTKDINPDAETSSSETAGAPRRFGLWYRVRAFLSKAERFHRRTLPLRRAMRVMSIASRLLRH